MSETRKSGRSVETLISVDIEADGPIPGEYSMLSLGAVVVGRPQVTFYRELRPISGRFVPEAVAVTGLDREALLTGGAEPMEAMREFVEWAASAGGRPVFCSFSTWDWVFVYWYLMKYVGKSPFGHSSVDMKSFYMGRYGGSWRETGKRGISERQPALLAGLGPHTHHALDDAQEQGELFRRMLEAVPPGK